MHIYADDTQIYEAVVGIFHSPTMLSHQSMYFAANLELLGISKGQKLASRYSRNVPAGHSRFGARTYTRIGQDYIICHRLPTRRLKYSNEGVGNQ